MRRTVFFQQEVIIGGSEEDNLSFSSDFSPDVTVDDCCLTFTDLYFRITIPGIKQGIVDIITEENVSCGSILVVKHWEKGKRAIFPYLLTNNIASVKRKLEKMEFPLVDPKDWSLS